MSRLTDEELVREINSRGFRICEEIDGGDYLNGYVEWSPIDDARAVELLRAVTAADLKPEEVEALRSVRDIVANTQFLVSTFINNITGATREDTGRRDFALSVLDRLLSHAGGDK